MTHTKDEALKLALEALEFQGGYEAFIKVQESAATAIKQALAAPVQERNFCERCGKRLGGDGHIHTCTPPAAQRQWVGLTDEEIRNFINAPWGDGVTVVDFIRAIEAKIKEKNT